MTRNQRLIKILQNAKSRLQDESKDYICYAINVGGGSKKEREFLKERVMRGIAPLITYDAWIRVNHPNVCQGLNYNQRQKKAREGRIAWVDNMIKELK